MMRYAPVLFCALVVGSLLAVGTAAHAQARTPAQTAQACLTENRSGLRAVSPDSIAQQDALPLILALDDLIGKAKAIPGPASGWSLQDTLVSAYGQQADWLRTGAVQGQLLQSDMGLIYTWEDRFLGTICLLALPATLPPAQQSAPPVIGTDTIVWHTDPSASSAPSISQIIILSDRPN